MADYFGSGSNDNFNGGTGYNRFYLADGGDDIANGNVDQDDFFMGAALNAADQIDGGGDGSVTDNVFLEGDYSGGLTLADTTLQRVERVMMAAGYDYKLIVPDATIAAGASMTFYANLDAAHGANIDDHRERDGAAAFSGGAGADTFRAGRGSDSFTLTAGGSDVASGGAGDDHFYMGGALDVHDHLSGGVGNDRIELDGDYSAGLKLQPATLVGVEELDVDGGHSYKIRTDDATVGPGQQLAVFAVDLNSGDRLNFDGAKETDGSFMFVCGAGDDKLIGSQGDDAFYLGGGHDVVAGAGGADTFYFYNVGDTPTSAPDLIAFLEASDVVDISGIDANSVTPGNQAFTLVSHFTSTAGEAVLHFHLGHNLTTLDMDVDGDGHADATLNFTGDQTGFTNFVL